MRNFKNKSLLSEGKKYLSDVLDIPGCRFDCSWNQLKPKWLDMTGRDVFFIKLLEVRRPTSNLDLS